MTPTSCALCAATALSPARETHVDGDVVYTRYECGSCAGEFWWPFQNPGAAWYERDERYADRNQDPILTANKKQTDVLAHAGAAQGPLLDVGCGVGNFLAYAERCGWEAWGIDFDHDAIEAGKRTFGLTRLSVDDLSSFAAAHPNLRFSLITFFDVFEHLDNHAQFLELAKSLLMPGGAIALSVPYRHGWRFLLPNDFPPRHLTRWDERSLEIILARHGFSVSYMNRLPASLYYLALKLRFRFGRWSSVGLVRRAGGPAASGRMSLRGRLARAAAKAKDSVLFGLPALLIYVALLPTRGRYTDLYAVARLNP